ncbi:MAG: sugar kinase [Spirochaetota bacterium]
MFTNGNASFDLVSIGEPLIGIYPTDEGPDICRAALGGDTSNVALAAARLGLSVAYATAVGEDPYGTRFLRAWKDRGVDTSLVVRDPDRFTGLYVISFDEVGHRFAYYRTGSAASAYEPTDTMRAAIASARVLHVSGISQAISRHMTELSFSLMEAASASGSLVSYDVNYRPALWSQALAGAVAARTIGEHADIVSANRNEIDRLGLAASPEEFLTGTTARCRAVALRDGAAGSTVRIGGERACAPACRVEVVDTVGAGDAFDAALITAIVSDFDADRAVRFANAVAGLTCTATGSTDGHPTREQAEDTMRACFDNTQERRA